MGEGKDNLKKYGIEAFVPEDEEGISGNGAGMGRSVSGNRDGVGVSVSENGSVGSQNGVEGASGSGAGSDGGMDGKRSETPENGHRSEKMISEEEARRLLAEEKVRIEQGWKRSEMKHKRILVTVVIVAVALCAAGAIFAIMAGKDQGKDEAPKKDEAAVVTEEGKKELDDDEKGGEAITEQNADAEVQRVVALGRAKMEEMLGSYGKGVIEDENDPERMVVYYIPDGMITAVLLDKVYGVTAVDAVSDYGDSEMFYFEFTQLLIDEGFRLVDEHKYTTASAGPRNGIFVNEKTGVVCNVVAHTWLACGYKTWYDMEDAALSNELAQVILEATGKAPTLVVADTDNIKDSEISPYQRITVAREGYASLLYRVSPESPWQYFASGQSAPLCSEYNTEDLRKAFAGSKCFSDEPGPMLTVEP